MDPQEPKDPKKTKKPRKPKGPQTTQTTLLILKKAEHLAESIRTHMKTAASRLFEVFSLLPARDEGEPPWPDWLSVQEANLIQLEQATVAAQQTSQAYLTAKSLVSTALLKRDGLAKNLKIYYRNLRRSIGETYSAGALLLIGLVDPAARKFIAFREQCLFVARRLHLPGLVERLGLPVAAQQPLDIDAIATGFPSVVRSLEEVLDDLREYKKLCDEALIAKQEAEDRLRVVTTNVGRIQEGYYRLAGLDEEADRIRLTIPQSAK